MSNDDIAKEREFIANLSGDTGRDLAAWMAAIDTSQHSERNDIIDWLRSQGFTFSKASWLERIHHNDGRPIYIEDDDLVAPPPGKPNQTRQSTKVPANRGALTPTNAGAQTTTGAENTTTQETEHRHQHDTLTPSQLAPPDQGALETTLNQAKAYRPLAQYLVQEIKSALPSVTFHPTNFAITFANPNPFAVLDITAKGLRFALALDTVEDDSPLKMAKFPNPAIRVSAQISQELTHLTRLTDARQINDPLISLIIRSSEKVNDV
ncbi:MAG: DUF5655 domain-containing protein [Hyphomicrobiaceae bacterium]